MSASTTVVSCAEIWSDSTIRLAMTLRIRDIFSVLPRSSEATGAARADGGAPSVGCSDAGGWGSGAGGWGSGAGGWGSGAGGWGSGAGGWGSGAGGWGSGAGGWGSGAGGWGS